MSSRLIKSLLFLGLVSVCVAWLPGCTNANSVLNGTNPLSSGTASDTNLLTTDTTTKGNSSPLVNLNATGTTVGFGGQVFLTAESIDPDGDQLSFSWNASSGTFLSQSGNRATWKAPDQMGPLEVTCTADDKKGGKATAKTLISVVGGRTYSLTLQLSRNSLLTANRGDNNSGEYLPVPQAKISIPAIGQTAVTDQNGEVVIDLDSARAPIASETEVIIHYVNWELHYQARFPLVMTRQRDTIQLLPGFDGVTVALARGDTFTTRRSGVEVYAVESQNGQSKTLREVQVTLEGTQQMAPEGIAYLSAPTANQNLALSLSKSGYSTLTGIKVPVVLDGTTLVFARLLPSGGISQLEPFVSWTRPYNSQKAVSVIGPFEIGFGQPMEQSTILDDVEMTIQVMGLIPTMALNGPIIKQYFTLVWDGPAILRFIPKKALPALKQFSVFITRWSARTADGRMLRNYSGMFGSFTTDLDSSPTILSTSPRNGEKGLSRSGPFIVTFDRPMDPTSLRTDLELEISSQAYPALKTLITGTTFDSFFSAVWSQNNTLLSLVPKSMLAANTAYLVRALRFALKSESGKSLTDTSALWGQFTTGDL